MANRYSIAKLVTDLRVLSTTPRRASLSSSRAVASPWPCQWRTISDTLQVSLLSGKH